MKNERVEEFLDLYKKLEHLLKQVYNNDSGRYENVVSRYENSGDCGSMRDEIRAIREIRNLIQHNPKVNGNYIVVPSDDIMRALPEVIRQVEHPRLAVDFGVKANQIYKTMLGSGLLKVIHVMKDRGFSHVPVMENDRLYGVLSAYAVFEFITEQGMQILTDETKVSAMKAYLPIEKHRKESYLFMPKEATLTEAGEAFQKRDSKGRRIVVIFITEHGNSDEPLLAMLTPWSIVGK